jgi:hypothetical protein
MSPLGVAKLIREHEIDVVIDLAGYTSDAMPDVYSYRPAPAHVGFLGYPGTLGSKCADYILADSVIIPANDTVAFVNIFPLPAVPPTGPRTVKLLILAPYNCGINGNVIDSASILILDSIYAVILTPDTLICKNSPVHIRVDGDSLLSYTWTPALGLNNPNIKEPTAIPLTTTTYKCLVALPATRSLRP